MCVCNVNNRYYKIKTFGEIAGHFFRLKYSSAHTIPIVPSAVVLSAILVLEGIDGSNVAVDWDAVDCPCMGGELNEVVNAVHVGGFDSEGEEFGAAYIIRFPLNNDAICDNEVYHQSTYMMIHTYPNLHQNIIIMPWSWNI